MGIVLKLVIGFLGSALILATTMLAVSIAGVLGLGPQVPGRWLLAGAAIFVACLAAAAVIGAIESMIASAIVERQERRDREIFIQKNRVADSRAWQVATCPQDMLRRLLAHGLADNRRLRLFSCGCIRLAEGPHCDDAEMIIRYATDRAEGNPDPPEDEELEILTEVADLMDHPGIAISGVLAPLCSDAGDAAYWSIYYSVLTHCRDEMNRSRDPVVRSVIEAKLCKLLRETFEDQFVDGPCW